MTTLLRTELTIEQWRKKERADNAAHKLAFESAVSLIECYSTDIRDSIGRRLWYEVDLDEISDAIAYLELRGLLRRHPKFPNRVNVRWA